MSEVKKTSEHYIVEVVIKEAGRLVVDTGNRGERHPTERFEDTVFTVRQKATELEGAVTAAIAHLTVVLGDTGEA